ncbi:MAG: DMT family transporter [Deltaproteobacteria bacterium]|uniref:DMT family transporter n=1 Tax=Candidatus Zymogenus saltonus TaxID=2844893 RepID=A0A9D8PPC4_9DELT|nr:DMT family transporter [Candidatus Zymogenus saltonus]
MGGKKLLNTSPVMGLKRGYVADLSLVLICVFWGMSFILVKQAIEEINLYYFIFLRFIVAASILLVLFGRKLKHLNKKLVRDGIILGSFLFIAFITQTVGLQYTSASNAGFITGLHVVLVPFVLAIFFKKTPALTATMGAVIAAVGLFFLSVSDQFTINRGDVWVILCSVSVAFQVILTGWYAVRHDVYLLTLVQVITVLFFSGIATALVGGAVVPLSILSPFVILVIILMAVFATAFNFTVQVWAQQYTTPTRAAVIFTMEPVFAALFAYLWGGEILRVRGYMGAVLIFLGIILSEFRAKKWDGEAENPPADADG